MIIPPENAEEIRKGAEEYRRQQAEWANSLHCRYCSEEHRWCRCHEYDPI